VPSNSRKREGEVSIEKSRESRGPHYRSCQKGKGETNGDDLKLSKQLCGCRRGRTRSVASGSETMQETQFLRESRIKGREDGETRDV